MAHRLEVDGTELRVYAPDQARFRWTAGTFFFYEKQRTFLGSVADQSNGFAGVEYNMPHVQSDSEAGYLDGTFDIRKFLRATGGFRFTREHKERTGLGAVYLPNTNGMPFRFGTEGFQFADTSRTIYDPWTRTCFRRDQVVRRARHPPTVAGRQLLCLHGTKRDV